MAGPVMNTPLQTQLKTFTVIPNSPLSISTPPQHFSRSLAFPTTPISALSLNSYYPSLHIPQPQQSYNEEDEEEHIVGDCVVFEEGIFEDPYLQEEDTNNYKKQSNEEQNLVPDEWKEAQMEINITKKERRKIAHQVEFGSRLEKKNTKLPIKDTKEYLTYKQHMMSKLKPIVLDNPEEFSTLKSEDELVGPSLSRTRVAPRNPRVAVYKGSLEDISKFFNSEDYVPGENTGKNSLSRRTLLTKEEKVLLNKRTPILENASSGKWLPLHTLAASGEFYLLNALMKHSVDINEVDADGLSALHKAILCRKVAVTNYLLRESANPFIRDKEGATLVHYAVQVAAIPTIKALLLYNVDINLADDNGWTPLHLAVQTRRTDVVKLLLIKGADKTLRNQDGLTPLDLCLCSGRATRTYELIKLLKQLPKSRSLPRKPLVRT